NRYHRDGAGKRTPVAITSSVVSDRDRGVKMIVQVIRDVTRERAIEDLKNTIISLVSHELRTPIGHIKGFASSLLEPDVEWDAETRTDFIEEIDREADRLTALVRDLLDMSKIEAGTAVIEKAPLSPESVTREALKSVESAIAAHQVSM